MCSRSHTDCAAPLIFQAAIGRAARRRRWSCGALLAGAELSQRCVEWEQFAYATVVEDKRCKTTEAPNTSCRCRMSVHNFGQHDPRLRFVRGASARSGMMGVSSLPRRNHDWNRFVTFESRTSSDLVQNSWWRYSVFRDLKTASWVIQCQPLRIHRTTAAHVTLNPALEMYLTLQFLSLAPWLHCFNCEAQWASVLFSLIFPACYF